MTASLLLVASLLVDAAFTAWELQRTQMPAWIGSALALIQAAAAVWVLIQYRGINISLQRFGAVAIVFIGLAYYGQFGLAGVASAQAKRPIRTAELRTLPAHRTYLEFYIAGCVILGIVGAILIATSPAPRRQSVLVE
jgi:hypothetical protein